MQVSKKILLSVGVSSIVMLPVELEAQIPVVDDQGSPLVVASGGTPDGQGTQRSAPAASEEIIVTAQRRAQVLTDVPISITAIGGESLQNRNVTDASDLAKLVPGLSFAETTFATPVYTLRGVGNNEASLGSASSVAIYTDEVPLAYPTMTLGSTLDIERIEVLKGPQGTLYGQNSTG